MVLILIPFPVVLKCAESDKVIPYFEFLFACIGNGTEKGDGIVIHALSRSVIDQIPESIRNASECAIGDCGINVHFGKASWVAGERYNFEDFDIGEFLFSISKDDAKKYLPRTYKKIYE